MLLAQQSGLTYDKVQFWFWARRGKIGHGRKETAISDNERTGDNNSSTWNIVHTCLCAYMYLLTCVYLYLCMYTSGQKSLRFLIVQL